ncbi:MAG: hypothetical protein AAFP77_07510 [Bacteroidota bacterium]
MQVLLVYERGPEFKEIFEELVCKLPKYTTIVIWVNRRGQEKIIQEMINNMSCLGIKRTIQVKVKSPSFSDDFRVWARDQFVTLSDKQVVESANAPYNHDLAEDLESQGVIMDIVQDPNPKYGGFRIHGGNILFDQDIVLIGANQFYRLTMSIRSKLSPIEQIKGTRIVKSYIRRYLGLANNVKIIPVGQATYTKGDTRGRRGKGSIFDHNLWQIKPPKPKQLSVRTLTRSALPDEYVHIDMFISLTGERVEIVTGKPGKPVLFLAQPVALNPKHTRAANRLEELLLGIVNKLQNPNSRNEESGFIVMRNPVPLISEGRDDAVYHIGMYNNCLVERISDQEKRVYLPSYATGGYRRNLKVFDQLNRQLWENLGYQVVMIEANFHNYAKQRGSLHCISNELERQ